MTTQALTGSLVRLTVDDPETDASLFADWIQDLGIPAPAG